MSPAPKSPASFPVVVRFSRRQREALRRSADARGCTVGALIREAVSRLIPRFPDEGRRNRFTHTIIPKEGTTHE